MPRLRVPRAIRPQVLPEDGVALDGLERDAFVPLPPFLLTLDKPTPLLLLVRRRHPQPREVRAPAGAVRAEVDHEGADAVAAAAVLQRARPVVVVAVVARDVVALRPHALDVQGGPPALEGARALLDAAHDAVAVEQGAVGQAGRRVDAFGDAVVDGRGGVFAFAGGSTMGVSRC